MKIMIIYCGLIFILINSCFCSSDWSYKGSTGPSHWPGKCQTGYRQSPISIIYPSPMYFGKFNFTSYDIPSISTLATNNGHTLKISFQNRPGKEVQLSGGGICPTNEKCAFNFAEIHFHWGSISTQGSEHIVTGKAYPMEAHLVHYNDKYKDLATAASQPDGLAVLGVLFHHQEEDNPKWDLLTMALSKLATSEIKTRVAFREPIPVSTFLPTNKTAFYRYQGSLTTPNCMESVTWTVFVETVGISEEQLSFFRDLKTADEEPLVDNYRPLQPLNHRDVYVAVEDESFLPTTPPPPPITEPDWCKTYSNYMGRTFCLNGGLLLCPVTCYDIITTTQP